MVHHPTTTNNTIHGNSGSSHIDSSNPYVVLGVNPTATAPEIRAAYRRAALEHHPDRQQQQSTPPQWQTAHERFAKIGAAYEVLADPQQRRLFDISQQPHQQEQQQSPQSADIRDTMMRGHTFHDPFSLFANVFREEFGVGSGFPGFGSSKIERDRRYAPRSPFFHDMMDDPFGANDFFRLLSGVTLCLITSVDSLNTPWIAELCFPAVYSEIFIESSTIVWESMNDGDIPQQPPPFEELDRQASPRHFVAMSNSMRSTTTGAHNGETTTTTERTRIVNGKRQSVKETVVTSADGTIVDRKVTGDDSLLLPQQRLEHQQSPEDAHTQDDKPLGFWWGRRRQQQHSKQDNDSEEKKLANGDDSRNNNSRL